jgi:hypothetical protein
MSLVPSTTPFPDAPAVADDFIPELPAEEVTFFSKDEKDETFLLSLSTFTRLAEGGLGSGDSICRFTAVVVAAGVSFPFSALTDACQESLID